MNKVPNDWRKYVISPAILTKEIPVLNSGFIQLKDIMPYPETIPGDLAIINAARTSYDGSSKGIAADIKLLGYLFDNKHTTPFEMVEFKFLVNAPLVVWWQWVRHRTMSYNAKSGRYTEFKEDDFYIPSEWRLQATDNKQASDGVLGESDNIALMWDLEKHYRRSFELYEMAVVRGVAREQARLFLPGFSMYYTWVVKVDAHNLMHFLKLRMHDHAQEEIRLYASAIFDHFFVPALPFTAEKFKEKILAQDGYSKYRINGLNGDGF